MAHSTGNAALATPPLPPRTATAARHGVTKLAATTSAADLMPVAGAGTKVGSHLRVGMVDYTTHDEISLVRGKAALTVALAAIDKGKDLDVLLAPEWFFGEPTGFYSAAEFARVKSALEAASANSHTLIVMGTIAWVDEAGTCHNTALVLCEGKTVRAYEKRSDGDDSDYAKRANLTWAPGREPGTFLWRGLRAGVEVCKDHTDRRLKGDSGRKGVGPLDLQLVVSAGARLRDGGIAVHDGGLTLLCDATGYGPRLWQKIPVSPELAAKYPTRKTDYLFHEETCPRQTEALAKDIQLVSFTVAAPKVA